MAYDFYGRAYHFTAEGLGFRTSVQLFFCRCGRPTHGDLVDEGQLCIDEVSPAIIAPSCILIELLTVGFYS